MILTRIKLLNFQCHSKVDIPIKSRITSIIGPSDVGKSAILRAIRWCLQNQAPSGFQKHQTTKTEVALEFVSGQTIQRVRHGSKNRYIIGDKVFEAVGAGGPPMLVSQICPTNELNFQTQHEAPLWFSSSEGEIARQLNQVVELDKMDFLQSRLQSLERKTVANVELLQEKVQEVQARLKKLDFVQDQKQDLLAIKAIFQKVESTTKSIQRLGTWMHRYNSIKRVEMPPDTGQMDALYERIKETTLKLEKLSDGIQQLRFAEDRLRQATEKLQRMEQQLHESTRNQLCPICQRPM